MRKLRDKEEHQRKRLFATQNRINKLTKKCDHKYGGGESSFRYSTGSQNSEWRTCMICGKTQRKGNDGWDLELY